MADTINHETENIENQPQENNFSDVAETVKKPEVNEAPTADETGDAKTAGEETTPSDADADETSRKRKSVSGDAPDEGEEEAKKAKTDDADTPTNGSVEPSDVPEELTTKKVADVQRLDDEEVAA